MQWKVYIKQKTNGLLQAGNEITEGPEVEKWVNGFENYSFESEDNSTDLTVEIDCLDEYLDYFNESYPNALEKLKEICEN